MTTAPATFSIPSEIENREAGDFERALDGRPYVYSRCECAVGLVPGKRPGTTRKHEPCKGTGWLRRLYSRITSYIDCLGDRTMLELWKRRMDLLGLRADPALRARMWAADPLDRKELNQIVELAFEAGDGYLKAHYGTSMHKLAEAWWRMEELPDHTDEQREDFRAYLELLDRHDIRMVDTERRCVIDELKVAGTPDNSAWWNGQLVLVDLKTGNVDIDPGKIAMQLAIASRGQWYDADTRMRYEMGVSRTVGLVIHVPKGTARATLYRADLTEGWRGIELARTVRSWRNESKVTLTEVLPTDRKLSYL
jgi:hypothetical protein